MTKLVAPIKPNTRDLGLWLLTSEFPSTLTEVIELRIQRRHLRPLVEMRSQTSSDGYTQARGTDFEEQDADTTDPIKGQLDESDNIIQEPTRTQLFLNHLKTRFIKAFGFDGYDQNTTIITSADGKESPYTGESLPLWVIITSLLGLPNRPAYVEKGIPRYTMAQFFRNFIGGWIPIRVVVATSLVDGKYTELLKARWTEKKVWQMWGLLVKILLILPIKLITIPFKILLNAVKLVTEFLLPLISYYTAKLNILMMQAMPDLIEWTVVRKKRTFTYIMPGDTSVPSYRSKIRVGVVALLLLVLLPLTSAVLLFQYATVLACRVGLALTSPAKSAQLAFALGRNLDIGFPFISNIVGVLGALMSLALSAVLWTIALPLALGALVTAIPSILTAITWVSQIPFVATSLTWISQLPVVTGSMVLLNSFFGTVGGALAASFGVAATTLASLISVQIPAAALVVGTTLGLLVTPVAAMLSLGADKLSDFWATWICSPELGPIGKLTSRYGRSAKENENELHVYHIPVRSRADRNKYVVSTFALDLVNNNHHLEKMSTVTAQWAEYALRRSIEPNSGYRPPRSDEMAKPALPENGGSYLPSMSTADFE